MNAKTIKKVCLTIGAIIWVALVLTASYHVQCKVIRKYEIDFSTERYRARQQKLICPQNFTEEQFEQYSRYCPKAQEIISIYSEMGLEEALRSLHATIASSMDPVELLEVRDMLRWYYPLLADPETIFRIFGEGSRWSGNEKIAADYIVAVTYDKGNFSDAIELGLIFYFHTGKSDQDEKEKLLSDEAFRRLKDIFSEETESPVIVLAWLDYIGIKAYWRHVGGGEEENIKDATPLMSFIEESYPESAFYTGILMIIGSNYRTMGDMKKATEFYERALEYPDFQTFHNGKCIHDTIEELLLEIQEGGTAGSNPALTTK